MITMTVGLIAVAIGTKLLGWMAVPLVGLVVGLVRTTDQPVLTAAAAGALGWGGLLMWGMTRGPVLELADLLGEVFGGLPGAVVLIVTLLLPALLAGAAAGVGSALRSE
jgi:hypothetical protein